LLTLLGANVDHSLNTPKKSFEKANLRLAAGCWLLAAGCWLAGFWFLAAGLLVAGCWLLVCWLLAVTGWLKMESSPDPATT
jgi:hypothetical protein